MVDRDHGREESAARPENNRCAWEPLLERCGHDGNLTTVQLCGSVSPKRLHLAHVDTRCPREVVERVQGKARRRPAPEAEGVADVKALRTRFTIRNASHRSGDDGERHFRRRQSIVPLLKAREHLAENRLNKLEIFVIPALRSVDRRAWERGNQRNPLCIVADTVIASAYGFIRIGPNTPRAFVA